MAKIDPWIWIAAEHKGDPHSAAWDASAPPEVLEHLASYTDEVVRKAVAQNANAPGRVLAKLAADKSGTVRKRVALNAWTSNAVLRKLARDRYMDVAKAAEYKLSQRRKREG